MMRSFIIARLTASFPRGNISQKIQLGSLLRPNAFLFSNSFTSECFSESESESESERNQHKDDSFTVSYLVNSCGLSPELALKLSKGVNLKNPDGPNAVLGVFKDFGFSETQIAKVVEKRPLLLVANAETTLLPKLKFFHSIGVSSTDLPKILVQGVSLLSSSLENCLMPRYKVVKSVLRNEEEAVAAIRNGPRSFTLCGVIDDLVPNVKVLRQFGVPQASISYLVCNHPRVAYMNRSKFVEAAKTAKEMGFDPLKRSFVIAVQVLAKMNKAMLESRLEVYYRCGWSRDISLLAFNKYPQCMLMSDNKIMKTMKFLVKEMGWPAEDIARTPGVLSPNLEKRIIPRCTVVKTLKSKGLIKNDLRISSFILPSEKNFLKKYVTPFKENAPLLLKVYQGQTDHLDAL